MRKVTWGTPKRSEHYLVPRPAFAFVKPSLLGGLILLLLMTLAYCVGFRRTVSPGPVIGAHAPFETSCQGCHAPREGASNARCQRCHDPGGAGRLDNRAHVLFGSGDAKKAAAAPLLRCAECHVEHRGSQAKLEQVDQLHCTECHFRSLSGHPEFALLRTATRELPGIHFGHGPVSATASFKGHVNEVMTKKRLTLAQSCVVCHEPQGKDFQPVSFARHCAECHNKDLQATVGIPEDDVVTSAALTAQGIAVNEAELAKARGKVAKTTVRHKDDWIVASVQRLHAELEPDGAGAERAALKAQLSRLRRRLALAQPLATLDNDALRGRQQAIAAELKGLDQRLKAQAGATAGALERVDEALGSLFAVTTDAGLRGDGAAIRRDADALKGKTLPDAPARDFDGDRKQVLALLDGIETADPGLQRRVEDLRRRVAALAPGESTLDVLARAREQRQIERERISDEMRLRAQGPLPAASAVLLGAGRVLETSVADLEARLVKLDAVPLAPSALSEDVKSRKKDSLEGLLASCVKCHVVAQSALARVRAAQPVLVRGRFVHQPHLLQADCVRCHPGLAKSPSAQDLNFRGIASCRDCHRPRAVRQDCLTCHSYHAPSVS